MTTKQQERIESLCAAFHLPTVAAEVVPRFRAAEHGPALPTLLEVFELEAGDRRQRREDRLRRAAKLPAGRDWCDVLDDYEERAAIMEFDFEHFHPEAEDLARKDVMNG